MANNPVASALRPLLQAAAGYVVGPLGLIIAPAIATVSMWASAKLGGESEAARSVAEVLGHIFGHLSGDAAKELFTSLDQHGNHDLEVATATAVREALRVAQKQIAPSHQILAERFESWFNLWDERLNRALETTEDTALLFYSGDSPDPVSFAAAREDHWWPSFKPVLLRWASEQQSFASGREIEMATLPVELDRHLAKNLLGLARQALRFVLREASHERAWIAWQQQFLETIAKQTRGSAPAIAGMIERLASQANELRPYLETEFSGVHFHLEQIEAQLAAHLPATSLGPHRPVSPVAENYVRDAGLLNEKPRTVGILDRLREIVSSRSPTPESVARRNRLQMIKRVRYDWVDGILRQSPYRRSKIELRLEYRCDLLEQSSDLYGRRRQIREPLPPGSKISGVFDDRVGQLLILGDPGAGKTTLLVELASDLLDRAERDEAHPIPVVFNLSSWPAHRQPVKDWMVHELAAHYDVPGKLASAWIESQSIIPLLDGLDEVRPSHRDACVEAINTFRKEYGLLPIAVCSRTADYEILASKLRLLAAVAIRPLDRAQIQEFLASAGDPLEGLHNAADRDSEWWGLLDTPLMLSIAASVYEAGPDRRKIASVQSEIGREQLFRAYVEAMFSRHGRPAGYSHDESVRWLHWLAASLIRRGQSVFNLETLNRYWLNHKKDRRLLRIGFVALVSIIVGYLFSLAGFGLGFLTFRPFGRLIWGYAGLVYGFAGAVLSGLLGLAYGSFVGFCLAIGGALDTYAPVDKVSWSWPAVKRHIFFAMDGGLLCGLPALIYALSEGFGPMEIAVRRRPFEGVRRSGRNALITGFMQSAAVSYAVILLGNLMVGFAVVDRPLMALAVGPLLMLPLAPMFGLEKGGGFWIRHWVIRLLLWRRHYCPLRYVRFLDYACECVFLRRVGGGYVFIHRMLLEHFAAQCSTAIEE